ncbi:type II/IV secretion system protein [Candidatus Nomurabacteria bacterium]|nr:type II/IV secretion system protein [Candidatus Nomurabacteria bacterium]
MDNDASRINIDIGDEETKAKLDQKLSSLTQKSKEEEIKQKAALGGWSYINLDGFPISQEALKIISHENAEALQMICFLYTGEEMRLASVDPENPQIANLVKELAEKYHSRVKTYLISPASFEKAIKLYDKIPNIEQFEGFSIAEEDLKKFDQKIDGLESLKKYLQDTNLSETITLIVAASLKFDASDIHLETEEKNVKVRFRIDGVLQEVATLAQDSWQKMASRIKLLAGLKLNIDQKPQDGRFTITLTDDKVDVRVSTIPSIYGESIVLRLLRSSRAGLEFEKLGLRGKSFNDLTSEIQKPNGMIITTGPTGSGKTTTLYAVLNKLNTTETKIITLEDPIEYKLPGIVQSQVENSQEQEDEVTPTGNIRIKNTYTFAKGLRAILRQDPDIVMVGEIRDLETAETAINAALTGHLMLSTMHTNSAAGTIPRFLAMGVPAYLLAPSLNAIIGQRLVRRLCQKCKAETEVDNQRMTIVMNALNTINAKSGAKVDNLANLKFYKAVGCPECNDLGYKGRLGIYEIMTMSPSIEKIILSGDVSEYDIEKIAIEEGMVTMFQDGVLKAMDGLTSLEEVFDKAAE